MRHIRHDMNNINNSQQRITGFTPEQIKQAYEHDDKELLDKAYDTELTKKVGNLSQQIFKIRDSVRLYQPSDKTRQVWSNKIYTIEKVFKPQKSYGVYEYKLKDFTDRFKEE
jgi:hypothetical protein